MIEPPVPASTPEQAAGAQKNTPPAADENPRRARRIVATLL